MNGVTRTKSKWNMEFGLLFGLEFLYGRKENDSEMDKPEQGSAGKKRIA